MAIQTKIKAKKHFQYKKALRIPGEIITTTVEDAEALIGNGKAEAYKEPKSEKPEVKPA